MWSLTPNQKQFLVREAKEWAQSIVIALVLTLILRAFVIQAFKIPSGSMRPTLMEGDKIFVYKPAYFFGKPQRGDIVVFESPNPDPIHLFDETIQVQKEDIRVNGILQHNLPWYQKAYYQTVFYFLGRKDFIKRLVASPGDTVEIQEGKIRLNGVVLNDPETFGKFRYINHEPYGGPGEIVTVPPDSFYVLGDNSANSKDSRFWGFVPKRNMIGKAVFRWWPPRRIGPIR